MIKINNKFAIGCLIQWYEIEIVEEYLISVKQSLDVIDNKENVIIDLYFNTSQALEKIDEDEISISEIKSKYYNLLEDIFDYDFDFDDSDNYKIRLHESKHNKEIYTIADYRREFNDKYCTEVDVLMWGETDSILPEQNFQVLDILHTNNINKNIYKYLTFFSICKMWDDSWKVLEHPDFTDKPFIDGDTKNWWSLRYTMNQEEMNKINNKVEELDVKVLNQYKFNGCGLVISSEVIKSGVNIPRSVFFIHEDTAFLHCLQKVFGNSIPQFVIKNILLVHNRKHPKKRMYVKGEHGIEGQDVGTKRQTHSWYDEANKMCEHNAYNLFNQSKTYTWEDVFEDR